MLKNVILLPHVIRRSCQATRPRLNHEIQPILQLFLSLFNYGTSSDKVFCCVWLSLDFEMFILSQEEQKCQREWYAIVCCWVELTLLANGSTASSTNHIFFTWAVVAERLTAVHDCTRFSGGALALVSPVTVKTDGDLALKCKTIKYPTIRFW